MTELKIPVAVKKRSAGYWRVTLDNPPINLFDPEMIAGLRALVDQLERDREVKVVVFDSADPDYFIAHLDLVRAAEFSLEPGPTGLSPWPDVARRLEQGPFVTVGLVRGRARGVGSEFLQALDIRFASRERAILSQIELGTGIFPGGGHGRFHRQDAEALPGGVSRSSQRFRQGRGHGGHQRLDQCASFRGVRGVGPREAHAAQLHLSDDWRGAQRRRRCGARNRMTL